jgi:hypothetical protein
MKNNIDLYALKNIIQYTKVIEVLQILMNKWACPISIFE